MSLYRADSNCQSPYNIIGSPKTARNEQVLRTKGHTGSKFSKTSLRLLCTRGIVVVHLYCGFSLRQMAPADRQIPNHIFDQFFTSLRKDSVANYASIWTMFSPTVRGLDVLYKALNIL